MQYLVRPKAPPFIDQLAEADQRYLRGRFDAHPAELTVNGDVIPWQDIDEVEVVKAARRNDLSGWFVRKIVYQDERYHVGIYYGKHEQVLTNVTLAVALFVVQAIAYYMQTSIKYTGLDDIAQTASRD
ncbi:MAG: hypothetical protein KJ065_06710 [Anaerolineae bacterium]|nr:hypothetical protein [Anaerolineae bacterium]